MWTTEWIPRKYTQTSKQHEEINKSAKNQERDVNIDGIPY